MHAVELPRQYATNVKEVGSTVFIAAILRQQLQHPVAISGTTIQQQRHMILDNRYLQISLTGKRTNTGRARQFLHIGLFRGHFQHTADSASIFHRNTRLEQLHILYRIRIERRKQSEQVRRIIHRTSIKQDKVLVGSTSSHIIAA